MLARFRALPFLAVAVRRRVPLGSLVLAACLATAMITLWAAPLAAQQAPAPRRLAPGVLRTIPPDPLVQETFSGPMPLIELVARRDELQWKPNFHPQSETLLEMAKHVTFRRPVWNLEFSFKPLRMIQVDIPQASGRMQRKLIWYMVYRVRYLGRELYPKESKDDYGHVTYPAVEELELREGDKPGSRIFFPHFVLRSHDFNKEYLDRVIPAAIGPIQQREMPGSNIKLHNSVEIMQQRVYLSDERFDRGVWGVVTWEDVDPRIDYLSIYVQGLTNAFKFQDNPDVFQKGDPPGTGRSFQTKTLQLNFWRPGDTELENEEEIRYGVPVDTDPAIQRKLLDMYGLEERLDHLWVYR